ncbi:MAG: hypothetical protein K2X86_06830 [Cytophagaceae bacterium]|nr:hypothetical protein [Cytophagaceae bacterium]
MKNVWKTLINQFDWLVLLYMTFICCFFTFMKSEQPALGLNSLEKKNIQEVRVNTERNFF